MPDQRYDAARQTIGGLLSTTSPKIEVPEWQRSYSWDTQEIESFWQDLLAFDKQFPDENIVGEEYFLGSIVLVTGGPKNSVLDGQQRLATATILLSVLRDLRREYNSDAAGRLQNKYICDFDDGTQQTTYDLTLGVYDRDFFRAEIQDMANDSGARPKPELKSHTLIRKARNYFSDRMREESEAVGGGKTAFDRNLRIGRVLCDHLSVVAVSSTDEDNAASVFETLNDRGIGLSTTDLVRNLLLRRAEDEDARDRIVSAWQKVLAIHDEANVDDFLRHFWVSHYGDVRSRKLYREIKSTIVDKNISSLEMSLELAEAAPQYRDIVMAKDENAELSRLLDGIKQLGAKALYPTLLSGYAVIGEADDKSDLITLASALTTMFVRYNVIGGRETTVMESKVFQIAAELRSSKDFGSSTGALSEFSPSAGEFVARFQKVSINRTATNRYLLRMIEHAMRETGEDSVEGPDRVHVEHIYPQNPESDQKWDNHSAYINRLGNLTLLGKRLNMAIRNADFETKKTTDKGYKQSAILMTKKLLDLGDWNPDSVEARQVELSDFAFGAWHFPGEEEPSCGANEGADEDAVESEVDNELPDVPDS